MTRLRAWRVSTRVAGVLLGALGLAACAPSTGDSAAGGDSSKVKLTVWSWRVEDAAAYQKIFDAYEEKHPGVTVEFQAFKSTEYETKLGTGLGQQGGPDVAQVKSYGKLQPFVEAGQLAPLDGKVPGLEKFDKTVLDGARGKKDGKIYGVPFAVQTLQVFYNKELFARHGIQPPTTWDQMLAAARELKQAGVIPFSVSGKELWVLPIVHEVFGAARYGGRDFEQAVLSGRKTFTDPDYVASLDLVKQLQPYFPENVTGVSYAESQLLFTSGRAAMFPGGAYELGFFQSQAPDLDIGVFEVPPPPGARVRHPLTPGYADGSYAVSAKSAHPREALELVRWMATPEFGQLFSDKLKQISPVPGVTAKDPLVRQMAGNYAERGSTYLMLVHFRYGRPVGTDVAGAAVQAMLLGRATGQQAGQRIATELGKWFRPGT